MPEYRLHTTDSLEWLKQQPDNSVDLVFCSPPYEDARLYGELNYKVKGMEWVHWCWPRYMECLRVCKGLVAWVVEGKTKNFQWSATPALLMAMLHLDGVKLRKPPIYKREGIPGSGSVDWLKNKYEFIVCATKSGKLPWSDNTACGHPPIYGKGGPCSYRDASGERLFNKQTRRQVNGVRDPAKPSRPLPKLSNPGNIVDCGANTHFGKYAHENEAPFPLALAEFFVKSFCPPGGTVLDIFSGSGTTCHAAYINGRNSIGVDIRESQTQLASRRLEDIACR